MSSIVTFYSFKGGVGRTMALANIAVLLVRRGLRVLAVDWDLEAPGLERYFQDFDLQSKNEWVGLIDLLVDASHQTQKPDWHNYISHVDVDGKYPLSVLTSGRRDDEYASKVLSFDWNTFFKEAEGGHFIESLRDSWREEFDVVLIDSRTGITDSGGICTIQLPDVLVLVFTSNEQSLQGAKDMALRAQKGRQKLAYDRMPLLVLPLPSRFEGRTQFKEAKDWLRTFAKELRAFYEDWLPKPFKPIQMLERTKLPYIAYFSFGEKLPVVTDGTSDPEGLGYAYQAAAMLIGDEFKNAGRLITDTGHLDSMEESTIAQHEKESKVVTSAEIVTADDYAYDVYISFPHVNQYSEWIQRLVKMLQFRLSEHIDREAAIFMDLEKIPSGGSWPLALADSLKKSRCMVAFLSPSYFRSRWCLAELQSFIEREKVTGRGTVENPHGLVMLIALTGMEHFPKEIRNRQIIDFARYFVSATAFWETIDAVKLEKAVRDISFTIATSIINAPPFRADFPIIENPIPKLTLNILKM